MITAVLITARLGSERLRRKHLQEVAGVPILEVLIRRLREIFRDLLDSGEVKIIIATTPEPENEGFNAFIHLGVEIFFGSVRNIPLRHLQAAKCFNADAIIAVDGDDIFCSMEAIRGVYEKLCEGLSYVRTIGLPLGMNAAGYSVRFLEKALVGHWDEVLETGWGRIFEGKETVEIPFSVNHPEGADESLLRFTLDYNEDLTFFRRLIEVLGRGPDVLSVSDQAILDICWREKVYELNASKSREYWSNFQRAKEAESNSKKI